MFKNSKIRFENGVSGPNLQFEAWVLPEPKFDW